MTMPPRLLLSALACAAVVALACGAPERDNGFDPYGRAATPPPQAQAQPAAYRPGDAPVLTPREAVHREPPAEGTALTIQTHAFRPERRDATDARIAQLRAAPGFAVDVFARDLGHARMLLAAPDGTVYLTRPEQQDVMMLRDTDGDGRADQQRVVASNLKGVHGLALRGDQLYLAGNQRVWRARRNADGTLGTPRLLVDDLPSGAQHPNRTIAFGPDGMLYLSIGSSCNACDETDPEHATMLRADADLRSREVFARGLRNTIGFDWHPATGELWGMDHGSDMRGDDLPPEELNRLTRGAHYGWPWAFGKQQPDYVTGPPPGGESLEAFAARTQPAVMTYTAHAAPIGMVFYDGDAFPADHRGDAFVVMRGSWNRFPAVGYELVRVDFDERGQPRGFETMVSGFLVEGGRAHFGRLAGITQAPDGSILFSDDTNGMVYRLHRPATTAAR